MCRRAFLLLWFVGCAATHRGVIWGEVTTPAGPIARAHVQLVREGEVVANSMTDERGRFEVRGLAPGKHRVEALVDAGVLAPGTSSSVVITLLPDRIRNASVRIVPASHGAPISGVLLDQLDRPVGHQEVCASSTGGFAELDRCTSTDALGRFTIPWLPHGPNSLSMRSDWLTDRYRSDRSVDASAGASEVIVRARYVPELTGKVVDEQGVSIGRFNVDDQSFTGGRFATRRWRADQRVELAAPGFATEFVALPAPNAAGDVSLGTVVLTRGQVFRGRVIDAATKKPVEGATVARSGSVPRILSGGRSRGCANCYEAWAERQLPESVTDADGRFELQLAASSREVTVLRDGYRRTTTQLSEAAANTLAIDRGAIIRGRAIDEKGEPLAGAHISVSPGRRWARADLEGRFEVSGLDASSFVVSASKAGHGFSRRVDTRLGMVTEVELRPVPGVTIQLELRDTPRLVTICDGDCALPSTESELATLLEQSMLADAFTRMQFSGRLPGFHTLIVWRLTGNELTLERQRVTVAKGREFISWKPEAKRRYTGVSEAFLSSLPVPLEE